MITYQLQFAIVPVDYELLNASAKVASSRKAPIVSLFPISHEARTPRATADSVTAQAIIWYAW